MKINTYIEGLKFGMLLQLAIGPMCLMVFNTAKNEGFFIAMSLVLAIVLADAVYITLASLGISKILDKKNVKAIFKLVGSIVLMIFGLNIVLNVFNINIIPGLNINPSTSSLFIMGLILTLSNPITIVFWGSILTTKLVEEKMSRRKLIIFSIGLVSATVFFLTVVAILGIILSEFIPKVISNILNLIVGILIIFFGIKMLLKKDKNEQLICHRNS